MTHRPFSMRRRDALRAAFGAAAATGLATLSPSPSRADAPPPKFLVVVGATGGASIIDSFLAVRHSECPNYQTVNCFPDEQVISFPGSPLRAVDLAGPSAGPFPFPFAANQSNFVRKHRGEMLVATMTHSSVNHLVGQKRAITGNNAWRGRTLQECVALAHGRGALVPNVNMAGLGFAERGLDDTLPDVCYAEAISHANLWPFGLSGSKGVRGAPAPELVRRARALRDEGLDPASAFSRTFGRSPRLELWRRQRLAAADFEARALIDKLMLLSDDPSASPLSAFGLGPAPELAMLRQALPKLDLDPLEAQAALSFLLFKHRVAVTATIWPTDRVILDGTSALLNPPLAFDNSHNFHRPMQAIVWDRTLRVIDRLIDLLKAEPFDATSGQSLWDHTLIYVATEFGRSKSRLGGSVEFGTGHDLNNGVLLISPLLKGDRVLGGVDPATGRTYGFDPTTGAPDPGRETTEADVFAGILDVLQVDTTGSGLPSAPPFRKGA